jgi:hypothetical protein
MVKPVVNFMENYRPTPNRIFDLYNYYLGGGANTTGTGTGAQVTPPGFNPFVPTGGGGGGIMSNVQPFRADPRVPAAFEAMQRSNQLASMGINDPFANEATLAGAYYGDMPEDTSNLIGKQSMLAKGMGKVKGLMDNPLFNLVGTAINPIGGAVKGLATLANRFLPVNTRSIQEGIAGNLGIRVDDIGRIVNTGNYMDPNNIMAGYNLYNIDDETFEKRIDRINKGKLSAQKKAERIALIRAAQEKIMASKKLADEARQQKELERQRAEQERQRQRDQRRSDRAYRDETGAGSGYSGGFDASTGNYDDPFSPGDTE